MGSFSSKKKQVPIDAVAKDIANSVSGMIATTTALLRDSALALDNEKLTQETAYLFMTAAHEAIVHAVDSQRTTVLLGQSFLSWMRISFAESLNYDLKGFGECFVARLDEYSGILHSDMAPESKIQQIGVSFSKHLNTADIAVIHCAAISFSKFKLTLHKFISDVVSRFDLS